MALNDIISLAMERKRGAVKVAETRAMPRPLPDGAFETVLLYVREVFTEDNEGVDHDPSFWVKLEQEAGLFTGSRKEAIFQYYLRGVNHVQLAETLLDYFPQYRTKLKLGDMTRRGQVLVISRLASALYEDYPPRYKTAHPKNAYS